MVLHDDYHIDSSEIEPYSIGGKSIRRQTSAAYRRKGRSMAASLKVEFHFDFGSPNAYLAELALPAIEQRTGVKFITSRYCSAASTRRPATCRPPTRCAES